MDIGKMIKEYPLTTFIIVVSLLFLASQLGLIGEFKEKFDQAFHALICTKYQWEECVEWKEVCDTCTKYEYRTIKDCEKCGYELKEVATVYFYPSGIKKYGKYIFQPPIDCEVECWQILESNFKENEIKFRLWCKDGSVYDTWVSFDFDFDYYKYTYPKGEERKCVDTMIFYKKECKECTIKVPVGTYPCNCRRECVRWEVRTGEACPPGARNCVCIQRIETCGNGICEPQYGETPETCPSDCKKTCEDFGYTSTPPECKEYEKPVVVTVDGLTCYNGCTLKTCEEMGYQSTPPSCPEGYEPETVKFDTKLICYTGKCIPIKTIQPIPPEEKKQPTQPEEKPTPPAKEKPTEQAEQPSEGIDIGKLIITIGAIAALAIIFSSVL